MTPDDDRHGTYAGAVAHWFDDEKPCDDCARAEWRYRKGRKLDALHGNPRTVPAIGIKRRIHALMAIGYSLREVAETADVSIHTLRSIDYHQSSRIRASTATPVLAAYERMHMVIPDGAYSSRNRNAAAKKGYVPPLGWQDIDDADEIPVDWAYTTTDRATVVRELADQGENATHIARRLGVQKRALEKWCHRHMPDVWREVLGREGDWNAPGNRGHQSMRGDAA